MRIGIITALASEARTLPPDGRRLLGQHEFTLEVAGPGPAQAARAATRLADAGCEVLLSWGLAGGLNPSLLPGALIVATAVASEKDQEMACDPLWHTGLLAALTPLAAVSGRLYSARGPVAAPAEKSALFATRTADAVDMESAAIADVARARALAFAAVRCIVDPAGFALPAAALAGMGLDGRMRPLATALRVLGHPRELAPLLRLAAWYRTAIGTLTRAARLLCNP